MNTYRVKAGSLTLRSFRPQDYLGSNLHRSILVSFLISIRVHHLSFNSRHLRKRFAKIVNVSIC